MNKKGQIGVVIEGIVGILILLAMLPLLFQIGDIAKPQKDIVVNNTAVEQAKNLLSQLEICQKNYEDLNKSVITKNDLLDLTSVVKSINQNVMNIYEMNSSYIE